LNHSVFSVRSFAFSRFTPGNLFSTTVESTMLNCFSYKRLFYRMNDALDMIPSDNDSTDSEEEVETGCCKILICSRKSAALSPGKQSDRVSLLSTHWQKQGLNAMMLSICLSVCPFVCSLVCCLFFPNAVWGSAIRGTASRIVFDTLVAHAG